MEYTLAFSPCPNDTFIFEALINNKIDTRGIQFRILMEDVETLNSWALKEKADFTKVSYGVLPEILKNYSVLNAGGALGFGTGPLLIALPGFAETYATAEKDRLMQHARIVIPGLHTTAHRLLTFAYPGAKNKYFTVFSDIEKDVFQGKADAGVIIHENRFTYAQKGLELLMDLGANWENKTGFPVPLGGIVSRRNIDPRMLKTVNDLIEQSTRYAFKNYTQSLPGFVTENAIEMNTEVMHKHINLYVNDYSINLGESGQGAVMKFLNIVGNNFDSPEKVFAMPLI